MLFKRPQIQPTFPKAILVVAIVCGVLMVKFKHPHIVQPTKNQVRKLRSASLGMPQISKTTPALAPKVAPRKETVGAVSVLREIQEAKKFGPQLEEDFNRVSIAPSNKGSSCVTAVSKLQAFAPMETVKLSQKPTTIVAAQKKEITTQLKKAPISIAKPAPVKIVKKIDRKISLVIQPRMKYPIEEVPVEVTSEIDLTQLTELTERTEPGWTDTAFDEASEETALEESLATPLNSTTPIDNFVAISFAEESLAEAYNEDYRIASVQLDVGRDPLASLSEEKRLFIIEGTFEKIDFEDLTNSAALLRESEAKLGRLSPAPLPKLAWNDLSSQVTTPELVNPIAQKKLDTQTEEAQAQTEPVLVVGSETSSQRTDSVPEQTSTRSDEPAADMGSEAKDPIIEEPEEDEPTIVKMLHKHALEAGPKFGSLESARLSSQEAVSPKPAETNSQLNNKFVPPVNTQQTEEGGTIHGRLTADPAFLNWLETNKGHVELYLQPFGSPNREDIILIRDYWYPDRGENFQFNARNIVGTYQLIAAVHTPASAVPVAQIPYSKPISAADYKEGIYFQLKKETINRTPENATRTPKNGLILNLTLFEGASGSYRQPKNLDHGEVSVVGSPEWGVFRADKQGNVRIPKIPASSELIIEARANGYFSTRQVIPIFSTDVYAPIYLIQKDKVETITKFFTKRDQAAGKSILMGRVFNTESRAPMPEQEISLSFRKGSALYFDVFPDPRLKSTRSSGLYAFFNVEPTFRSVYRAGAKHSLLLNVEPDLAYYVETGRGGSRGLKLTLTDPFANQPVEAKVHLVGDELAENHSDEKGKVSFEGLDLPPGVVTVEAQAEGYPTTWYTIPWSTREPEKNHTLYMMNREMVLESAVSIARVKREKHRGAIVGGAQPSLFRKGRHRIQIALFGTDGSQMSSEFGPFPLSNNKFDPKGALLLTRENPGFTFFNLPPGEYLLKWIDENKNTFRTHVVRVGIDRLSVVVN